MYQHRNEKKLYSQDSQRKKSSHCHSNIIHLKSCHRAIHQIVNSLGFCFLSFIFVFVLEGGDYRRPLFATLYISMMFEVFITS